MYLKDLNKTLALRLNIDDYNKLMELSKKRNVSISYLIRYIISEYLRKYK